MKNVLLLMVDDMIPVLGSHREAHIVSTPNLDRLASRGLLFPHAQAPAPICNPARTAILTGLQPFSSGVYGNSQWWRPALPGLRSLPEHFRENGYEASGCGKLYHHTLGFNPPDQWDDYQDLVYDDVWDRRSRTMYTFDQIPEPEGFPYSGLDCRFHEFDWGALPKPEREYGDFAAVDRAKVFLSQAHDRPFFFGCGLFHPHLPWYAPERYYDLIDPGLIEIPEESYSCDWDGIPDSGRRFASVGPQGNSQYQALIERDALREARRRYYASTAFTDAMIGEVLDALETSDHAQDTIVAFVGDHGFHVGEKRHFGKMALWRESTNVPMVLAGPGIPEGELFASPVSTIDLGATLAELGGVCGFTDRDSKSLVSAIPDGMLSRSAVCTHAQNNFAVVTDDWRYIRYADGTDELYDLSDDPNETKNLSAVPDFGPVIEEMAAALPEQSAPPAPSNDAYNFEPATHTWNSALPGEPGDYKRQTSQS